MHTCPDCGQACTCNGDIEDLMWDDNSPQAINCIHIDLEHCDEDDDWMTEGDALAAAEEKS